MKNSNWKSFVVLLCLCSILAAIGCDIRIGNWRRAKFERTIQKQAPLAPNATLIVETKSGYIKVRGADTTNCSVTATISVRALTEEQARQIAESVIVKLEPNGSTLKVTAEKPAMDLKYSLSISYDITLPRQTSVSCASSYGSIEIDNLNGEVKAKTSSGSMKACDIQGATELQTFYGSVTCRNISGDCVELKSSSGSITAENVKGSAQFDTSYGSITCSEFSNGDIELRTSSGKITLSKASFGDCDVHTSYGSVDSEELVGKSIKLNSGSGGINVRTASAKIIGVSTSYGHIDCRDITAAELTAKSGSGSIDIAMTDSAPAEFSADVTTSYGNIDFAAPSAFAGRVELETSYGSINTNLPITVSGEVSKKKLTGKIGEGKGNLHLQTNSGSINIR